MHRTSLVFGLLRLPGDLLACLAALYTAFALRFSLSALTGLSGIAPEPHQFFEFAVIASALLLPLLALQGLYDFRRIGVGREIAGVFFASLTLILLITAYFYFARELFLSRLLLFCAAALLPVALMIERGLLREIEKWCLKLGYGVREVVVLGNGEKLVALTRALEESGYFRIVKKIDTDKQKVPEALALLGATSMAEIAVSEQALPEEGLRQVFAFARNAHREFHFVPDLLGGSYQNSLVTYFPSLPLVTLLPSPLSTGWGRIVKRVFDLAVGTLALVCTLPIWAVSALAIKLDSPGPVFFSHYPDGRRVLRVGRHSKLFWFVKFRSMVVNDHMSRYAMQSHRDGPIVKIANDPRITRVGSFLRKTSIDELPNLLAVIKGDMSLIGPRPHLPEEVEKYQSAERRVLDIKPGITGLAQVSGRSDLSFGQEVALDVWYMENWSVFLDIKILFLTVKVVLFPKHRE